jgi:hypothetical protein
MVAVEAAIRDALFGAPDAGQLRDILERARSDDASRTALANVICSAAEEQGTAFVLSLTDTALIESLLALSADASMVVIGWLFKANLLVVHFGRTIGTLVQHGAPMPSPEDAVWRVIDYLKQHPDACSAVALNVFGKRKIDEFSRALGELSPER